MAVNDRGTESSAECTVVIGDTSLPGFLRGTLVKSVAGEILRLEGEWPPFLTQVFVPAEGPGNGEVQVRAVGPHAEKVCAALPQHVAELVASTMFDSDGFVVERAAVAAARTK